MLIDYKSLKILLTVIEKNHFERAASSLHMTQSAISQRIKQLEAYYGEPLLIRTQPYQATPLGEKLLSHYKKVALLEATIAQELTDTQSPLSFAIAINRDSLETWFKPIFPQLPTDITLDIFSDDQEITIQYLKKGLVIGAVSTQAKVLSGCHAHYLGIMDYCLVASPSFKKRFFRTLSKEALLNAPAILFDNKDHLHQHYLKRFFQIKHKPNYHFVPSISCFKEAAIHGLGYGLIPEIDIQKELRSGTLVQLAPKKTWPMPLYWHHFAMENKVLQSFNDLILKLAKKALKQDKV